MPKEMLINASEPGNIRVAILDHGRLDAYFEEFDEEAQSRGNIYVGRIANVEKSLDACFVEYGEAKHGFLPL
ncbi:MAG TPA: ribonuclease, partial [Myxococcota bacterium]|nr:ribonuclease [Myxococcota bacterium]